MNELRPLLAIGDSLFGTWTYTDDDDNPMVITEDIQFSSSVLVNGVKYTVALSILDQNEFPGEIEFLVQTIGWQKGIAVMDIKAISGVHIKHSEKHCFNIVEGIT